MKPIAFEYCRADTLEEALDLLGEFGTDAAVLAGGLSLSPMLNMRLVRPNALIDVNGVRGLGAIDRSDGWIQTGSMLRQADAMADKPLMSDLPLLAAAMPHVGHFQTRSRGTLGGSAAHADPSAEVPLVLATLGGEIVLQSKAASRAVPAQTFFLGALTTDRQGDELVTALRWPARRPNTGYAFDEIAQRRGDFAIAACAAAAEVDADGNIGVLSLGIGGVEDPPRAVDVAACCGAPATRETAHEIAATVADEADPMEDHHANAAYRRQLVRVLGARVLDAAFAGAKKGY